MGSVVAAQNKIWWKFYDDHFFAICLNVYATSRRRLFVATRTPTTVDVPVMSKEIQTRGLYNTAVTYVDIKKGLSKANNIKVFGQGSDFSGFSFCWSSVSIKKA